MAGFQVDSDAVPQTLKFVSGFKKEREKEKKKKPGVAMHDLKPSTRKADAGRSL